jgi:hypothetical protein
MSALSREVAPAPGELRPVLGALRTLQGRATVGDVVAATGLSRDDAEGSLRGLLESHDGHLQATEAGELIYVFDRSLIRRDHVAWATRLRESILGALTWSFKAWIVVMLVAYFVLFVVLVVAALLAVMSRGSRGRRYRPGGRVRIPSGWLFYLFWTPRWRYGRPYYGRRYRPSQRQHTEEPKPPFYKKVFAFVFGPDEPQPTQVQRDRPILQLIRARRGVLSTSELVQHTGLPLPQAESEMGRLMATYAGDVRVSRDGELVYPFPELMMSAHGPVRSAQPEPAWRRLENTRLLTGNERKDNALVAFLNGFNLLAAATAPLFIFPTLGIGGALAEAGLVYVPVVFSALFFAIPLARSVAVARENRARRLRNARKVLLGAVFQSALSGRSGLSEASALRHVEKVLGSSRPAAPLVRNALHGVASEFEADVHAGNGEGLVFSFPRILSHFRASEELRSRLRLEDSSVGEVVYSSADTPEEAHARDLARFDRELAGYVGAPERIGYLDDFELLDFDRELSWGPRRMEA